MAPIDKAIEALQGPNPPTQASVALLYGIKPSTLSRRVRGITTSKVEANSNKSLLTKPQQLLLVAYINKLCGYGLSPTPAMVRNFAAEIARKQPGKNWVSRFNRSYNDVLSSTYIAAADRARQKADNYYDYTKYFELVSSLIYRP